MKKEKPKDEKTAMECSLLTSKRAADTEGHFRPPVASLTLTKSCRDRLSPKKLQRKVNKSENDLFFIIFFIIFKELTSESNSSSSSSSESENEIFDKNDDQSPPVIDRIIEPEPETYRSYHLHEQPSQKSETSEGESKKRSMNVSGGTVFN